MVHLFERSLLEGDLPAVPRTDDAAIDDEIAAGSLEACPDGDSLPRLEKMFNQNSQAIWNGIRQLLRCQTWWRCGFCVM
jgi:hypothetical protein